MDSIFLLDEADRINFLHLIVKSFGCTYICLWSYVPAQLSKFLTFRDGFYKEESNLQPSSSSGSSLARRLFQEYQKTPFNVDNDRVPGFAFKNNFPYIELKGLDLLGFASIEAQLQFYREAKIKTAIFMGCKNGEIEIGMSQDTQVSLETEMKKWFQENFPLQALIRELPIPTDQNRPSSSSSSLRSLSMDSPEYSPLMFNVPNTSFIPENPREAPIEQALLRPTISVTTSPLHQAIQALSQIRNIQFPTIECEDAAMTKAILAVISSPSSSSSSHQPQQNFLPLNYQAIGPKASAFRSYTTALGPSSNTRVPERVRRQNMLKRSITFFKSLSLIRTQEQAQGGRPTTSTQLHHMISERRRREKLNESFQALRSLLPPGSKKDKASVLTSTTEYLGSLKAQVSELSRRNQFLEAQVVAKGQAKEEANMGLSNDQGLDVRLTRTDDSGSEALFVDLQVAVRGECSLQDLTIRMLEFLKRLQNVSLMSVEANTQMVDTASVTRLSLRLKIEEGEWDESAFQEAVKRVVADLEK